MLAEVVATSFRMGGLIACGECFVFFQPKIIHVPKCSSEWNFFQNRSNRPHSDTRPADQWTAAKSILNSIPLLFCFLKIKINKFYFSLQLLNHWTNVINVPTGRSRRNHPKIGVCSDSAVTPRQNEMNVKVNEGKFFKSTEKKHLVSNPATRGQTSAVTNGHQKSGSARPVAAWCGFNANEWCTSQFGG